MIDYDRDSILLADSLVLYYLDGTDYKDFTFKDITGADKKMSDYVGKAKIVVFDVWASWCAPCRAEMPIWKELHAELAQLFFPHLLK